MNAWLLLLIAAILAFVYAVTLPPDDERLRRIPRPPRVESGVRLRPAHRRTVGQGGGGTLDPVWRDFYENERTR